MSGIITAAELVSVLRRQGQPGTDGSHKTYPGKAVKRQVCKALLGSARLKSFRSRWRASVYSEEWARELVYLWALNGLRIADFKVDDLDSDLSCASVDLKELRDFLEERKYSLPEILFDENAEVAYWQQGEFDTVERYWEIESQLEDLNKLEHQISHETDPGNRARDKAFVEHRKPELDAEKQACWDRISAFNSPASKLARQQARILEAIKAEGFDPLKVPDGGKDKVRRRCLEFLHLFTPSSFDRAWKLGAAGGKWATVNKERYKAR